MKSFKKQFHSSRESGMTLIEIIVVISLLAVVYATAAPDLMLSREAEMRIKFNKVMEDIRSAYDLTVLTGKFHRMVFNFESGEYWLEETDAKNFKLGTSEGGRDQVEDEEKAAIEEFDANFEEYQELAGETVQDPNDDSQIIPSSPLIKAKDKLKPPSWSKITTGEWDTREIGPDLAFLEIQAEHHEGPQSLESNGEGARAIIYFFPQGYVERAIIKIADLNDEGRPDPDKRPTVVITEPLEGTGRSVNEEFNLDDYIEAKQG